MKIIVLSDSHGNLKNASDVIDKFKNTINTVIHLGDYTDDVDDLKILFNGTNFINVSGNCDMCAMVPKEKIFFVENKKIFITHGHKYNVKSDYSRLYYTAYEKGADICIFGHTHVPILDASEKPIIMNPGSISYPRDGSHICTYGIISIENDNISARIYGIYGKEHRVLK